MKKLISVILLLVLVSFGGYYVWAKQKPFNISLPTKTTDTLGVLDKVHSQGVYLKNLSRGEILIQKNTQKPVSIASLTKLVTAYLLLENEPDLTKTIQLDQRIVDELIGEGASLSGFKGVDVISIKDLAYGIVLPSGGDAAIAAANDVSGSEETFVSEMNAFAKQTGMKQTTFKNATGLDESGHVSTLKDLGLFMEVALKNQEFRGLVTTTTYQTEGTPFTPEGYYLESTLLKESSDLSLANGQLLGGKTGYTKKAGQCLISLADIKGEIFLLITTGAKGSPSTEQFNMTDAKMIYNHL
ncbi:D-alanyl-D-alanine carboxypeptidase [Vagococcus sp. DIV0080]|uniref:D-alanyl-D-alanine carboxypeptidase n=1 Tax=Candidatus Vagococcus giribetii TaxID=2230876 RepID=A0ABS3HSB6_9ENTE|nr:D-alanyl-D-alanine carboxypeptidase [Vagococcus sp. DIV0080]MBO0476043.1 D-alanyl-D-alanine carboxypeptidase [Vagococcus sp. DIV0080]